MLFSNKPGFWLQGAAVRLYMFHVPRADHLPGKILSPGFKALHGTLVHKLNMPCGRNDLRQTRSDHPRSALELARPMSACLPSPLYIISINKPIAERPLMRHAFPDHVQHPNPYRAFRFV